ncbi:MAG: PAS domain-containing protein [Pedobacter sp.]
MKPYLRSIQARMKFKPIEQPANRDSTLKESSSAYKKWITLCFLLINLFVIILVALTLRSSLLQYEKHASIAAQNLATILDKNIAGELDRIDMVLLAVADEVEAMTRNSGVDEQRISAFLARQKTRLSFMGGPRIADEQGLVKYGPAIESASRPNISDREHFIKPREIHNARLFISPPVLSRVSNRWVLPMSRRLNKADGTFAGVVYANIEINHFAELFSLLNVGGKGGISLRDEKMAIIARYPSPKDIGSIIGNKNLSPELQKLIGAGTTAGTFFTPTSWDNTSKVVSFRKIDGYPLYITIGIATDDYLSDWRKQTRLMLALSALFFLLTSSSAWLIYRNMTELRKTAAALNSAHEGLEQKVEERTIQLSQANNELQTILNTSPVGICCLNNRKVVWANNAFDLIFGYQTGTTYFLDTFEFYPDRDSYERIWADAYSLIENGDTYSEDTLMKKKDGTLFWCNMAGHAITPGNMPDGSIWIIQDISKRRQVEQQMISLAQRLQLATSSAHLGVWDWNVKKNTLLWDDRMFELYGITRETFSNNIEAWMNGLHPEDKETAIAECQAALKGEKEFNILFRIVHPDGAVKHLKANGLVIRDKDGTAERMIGINFDITDFKQSEEVRIKLESQLQQAQKMESVGRLAGGVAHDFNNMLTIILGHAELGRMHLDQTHPVCANLMEIRKTAERSADLTQQLLAFARKQAIVPKVIDLNETLTGMFKLLQRLIGENINLAWQPAPNLWKIKMDPSQIDQIMANLCINARDAIASTGRITIELENRTIDADYCTDHLEAAQGEYVRISISDDGCGMNKEILGQVFEPFFTTKEMGKGTGLGLATVYGVVKQNNGFINIYSEPEQGTTFSIYLPRYEGKIEVHTEGAAAEVPHGEETILLVEDEAAILSITTKMLEMQDYNVLAANTPGEAIKLAKEHSGKIHMLMTDVIMPEMNGQELAKKLLSIYPQMKTLFMSGYTADVIANHGVLNNGVFFIQKPFSLPNMAAKVREVLDGKNENE